MCAEKIQRLLMAAVIAIGTYLMSIGSVIGTVILVLVIVMIIVWAFTDFCPSIWVLKKITRSCYEK